MITLKKANLSIGEGRTVSVNIDDIIAMQTVPSELVGKSTTTVFVRQCQPLSVEEKEEDIVKMVKIARFQRLTGPTAVNVKDMFK